MALTVCKECGAAVSTAAKACPRCGAPTPKKKATTAQVVVAWAIIALVAVAFFRGKKPEEAAPAPTSEGVAAQEAARKEAAAAAEKDRLAKACEGDKSRTNWECFMTIDQMVAADMACQSAVSQRAAIDVKWDNGFFTRAFRTSVRDEKNPKIVRMATDRFQMQNSLGAWIRHRAVCEWDMASEKAKVVLIEPGNLKI